jgi:hypothetical protein
MSECYCDYGDSPDVYSAEQRKARVRHVCYECHGPILPGERYERCSSLFDGDWTIAKTCCRCLSVREYVAAHASCFCWLHGSMLDNARDVIDAQASQMALGLQVRVLPATHETPNV